MATPTAPGNDAGKVDAGDDDAEDTVLGAAAQGAPPELIEPGTADADTIVVTRAVPARPSKANSAPDPQPASSRKSTPTHEVAPSRAAAPPAEAGHPRFALRIGTHPPIPLDVPAYVGRRPSTPRITGTKMPRLVMVPSPSREVSSTHVEFRQEGATVVVTDLGSTNGTSISNPGFSPLGLRQGESVAVVAGSVVDIGDGIRIIVISDSEEPSSEVPA
ncbi:MAG: FHA domain-containing protein [Terrimesophilobacter sp.]